MSRDGDLIKSFVVPIEKGNSFWHKNNTSLHRNELIKTDIVIVKAGSHDSTFGTNYCSNVERSW